MKITTAIFLLTLVPLTVRATIDTLNDTSQVDDAIIYNYADCTSEISGEDCRRFNGGHVVNLGVGNIGIGAGRRALFAFPGWDGVVPDSAGFEIYCFAEDDTQDRRFFVYPLTSPFIEGSEASFGVGDYPDPDSGATWNHAWLMSAMPTRSTGRLPEASSRLPSRVQRPSPVSDNISPFRTLNEFFNTATLPVTTTVWFS